MHETASDPGARIAEFAMRSKDDVGFDQASARECRHGRSVKGFLNGPWQDWMALRTA
jgi:hypothetical protein